LDLRIPWTRQGDLELLLCSNIPGCNVISSPIGVSPNENSWMLHPFDKASLGYCAPDRTITSLILPAQGHMSVPQRSKAIARSYKVWAELAPDGGAQTYRTWSGLPLMPSRVGTHRSGMISPRDKSYMGRNIQDLSVGDTSVGDTLTLHPFRSQR
jgi:hypothetical protein